MDYRSMMESIAEWMAAANSNRSLFLTPNGVQSQALSLTTSSGNTHQNNSSDITFNSSKTISIRCVVESVPNVQYCNLLHSNSQVEVDRRANVPIHTVLHNLVEAVLQIFGYPKDTAVTAKGSIILENWRPIRLEKVAMNPQKTVNDILGPISSFVTLRIQILRTMSCTNTVLSQMKDKLLQLLIIQNIEHIISSGCPLDQITLKSILRGTDYGSSAPSDEILRKFEQWTSNQFRQALRPISYPGPLGHQFSYQLGSPSSLHYDKELINNQLEDRLNPGLQGVQNQYPPQKTRMRTSFDPELELPKLQKWFGENQHPDRQQIKQYVEELNSLESRLGRKPLDINNVVYWFKNARAAQKRAETRAGNPAGIPNSMNGYRSESHSPCETALTSRESLGSAHSCYEDYIEDDDNRSKGDEERDECSDARPSSSPVAPLSLTTYNKDNNNRSRNSTPIREVTPERPDEEGRRCSPLILKPEIKHSPANHVESDSDEVEMDEDASEAESVHKESSEGECKNMNSFSANSSPLSLIPRSLNSSLFPVVPNYNFSMFSMGQYMPGMTINMNRGTTIHDQPPNSSSSSYADDKRGKRNRTFIDPVTEVPCLERWFLVNTHPSQSVIRQYTDDLNSMPYRQKFPPLKTQNVQFWFKNRRAKCKRLKTSLYENLTINNNLSPQQQYHQLTAALSTDNYRNHD